MTDMREQIDSLSPRQRQILSYVAQHLSSKQIGILLDLSPATVDSHIRAALQRLSLQTRRDGAVAMIELGYATPQPDPETLRRLGEHHHGGDRYTNRSLLSRLRAQFTSRPSGSSWATARGGVDEPSGRLRAGMGRVIGRYLLDAFYISLFFAVMSAVAFGVHEVVVVCEKWKIDPYVLLILKAVSYTLAVLDAVGVVTATGLLTYRFIRAVMRADD